MSISKRRALSRRFRRVTAYLKAAFNDLRLWLTRKTNPHLPPLRLQVAGAGDFQKTGEHLAKMLVEIGGLQPNDRVLDIGCGVGRVAIPLTRYLLPTATYDGFDVMQRAIRWCRRHITPGHPHFRFHHVDLRNSEYSQRGQPASRFRFPFPDASFDFVFATSVFTHLVADETRQYLTESARALRHGGRLLATFFLLNDLSKANMPARAPYAFPFVSGSMRLLDPDNPGVGVAFEETYVADLIRDAGLTIERVEYGLWSGRPDSVTFQDVVVCRRA
jgi:SAM-dependent methyltransferase